MKELVEYLATSLVDDKESVRVDETVSEHKTLYSLSVKQDDLGKVIGKKGRTVKAMRVLLSALASTQGQQVSLQVLEPEKSDELQDKEAGECENDSATKADANSQIEDQKESNERKLAQDQSLEMQADLKSEVTQET